VSRVRKLIRSRGGAGATLTALVVALAIGGCGGGDDTTAASTSTTTSSAATTTTGNEKIDAALASCTDKADQIGGSAGTNLKDACGFVAAAANQILSSAGENASEAISGVADNCRSAVGQLPSGQAQDALSQFCDAIASAG
jgi:hypothetical protein